MKRRFHLARSVEGNSIPLYSEESILLVTFEGAIKAGVMWAAEH